MKHSIFLFLLFLFIFSPAFTQKVSQRITGKVIKIIDGDTFVLLSEDSLKLKIRMNGIDCPERKQAYYQVSKNALGRYIFNRDVLLIVQGKDRWRRIIANVYLNNESINLKMVMNGYAWHYTKYSNDKRLAAAEMSARNKKNGLWKSTQPIAPWKQREQVKNN